MYWVIRYGVTLDCSLHKYVRVLFNLIFFYGELYYSKVWRVVELDFECFCTLRDSEFWLLSGIKYLSSGFLLYWILFCFRVDDSFDICRIIGCGKVLILPSFIVSFSEVFYIRSLAWREEDIFNNSYMRSIIITFTNWIRKFLN